MSAAVHHDESFLALQNRTRPDPATARRASFPWPFIVVAIVCAGLAWQHHTTLRGDRDRVAHAQTVLLATASVGIQEDEAEAAERGYVLTGDEAALAGLHLALEALPGNAARVRRLVEGDPAQAARAATLEALVARRTEQMMHAVEVRRNLGPRAARDYALRTEVRNTDRRLRDVLAEIGAAERVFLTVHQDGVRRTQRLLLVLAVLTAALAFGAQAIARAVRRRRALTRDEPAPATA